MSIVIILAAVLVGMGKLLMPFSDRYQPRLEAWLSEEFGRPVELEGFAGEWKAFGPRLTLKGLTLLPKAGAMPGEQGEVALESAALDIKPLNVLIPGRPLYNFRVIGADFQLLRKADGQFALSGFGVSGRGAPGSNSGLRKLARVGGVILQDSSLAYFDEIHGIQLEMVSINGRLQMFGDELSTEVQASLYDTRGELVYGEVEATLKLKMGKDQKLTEALWQASAGELMLAAFQGKLPANPFLPLAGWLNAELWGSWSRQDGHRISGVSDLQDARLVNDYQDLTLDHVNMRFNWEHRGKGDWRVDIADLLFDDGVESWLAPNISMARNVSEDLGLWISADTLPLGVPLNLARDVMSVYGKPWPRFLPQHADGRVDNLELMLNSSWRLSLAQGSVRNASLFDWDRWPDIQGLDGEIVSVLRELAQRHAIWLLGGTFPEAIPDQERIHNTSVLIDPDGELKAIYRKIHLFDVDLRNNGGGAYVESSYVVAGEEDTLLCAWHVVLHEVAVHAPVVAVVARQGPLECA